MEMLAQSPITWVTVAGLVVYGTYKIVCRWLDRRELNQACRTAVTHDDKQKRDDAAAVVRALLDADAKRPRWYTAVAARRKGSG